MCVAGVWPRWRNDTHAADGASSYSQGPELCPSLPEAVPCLHCKYGSRNFLFTVQHGFYGWLCMSGKYFPCACVYVVSPVFENLALSIMILCFNVVAFFLHSL